MARDTECFRASFRFPRLVPVFGPKNRNGARKGVDGVPTVPPVNRS
jgi:hypothetical protein